MARERRLSAVIGRRDVLIPTQDDADALVAEGMLFEGFDEPFDRRYGVMRPYTLADVQQVLDTRAASRLMHESALSLT